MTVYRDPRVKNVSEVKKDVSLLHRCPFCGEQVKIGLELGTLEKLKNDRRLPYPHLNIHGDPLHAMLCYIDKDLNVRNVGSIESIEIRRDSETMQQLMKKWSNIT